MARHPALPTPDLRRRAGTALAAATALGLSLTASSSTAEAPTDARRRIVERFRDC